MWAIILLLLLLLITLLIFVIQTKFRTNKDVTREPPGPPRIPIIGNFHQLGSLPHRSFLRLSRKYGPVMLLRLGKVPLIVISSPEAAMEVLKTHDAECCSRLSLTATRKLTYNGLDMVLSPYGKHWREVRKFCVLNLFSAKTVGSFRSVREDEVRSLMDSLHKSSLSSSLVDIGEKMMDLTASITFRVGFGKCFGQDKDGFRDNVHLALSAAGSFAASDIIGSAGWIIDRLTGFHARLEKSFHKLDGFFDHVIGEHLSRTVLEGQEDLVDLLLKMEREKSESGQALFTRKNVKAILMDILLGGVDSGTVLLTWAMAELARNPRVMKKAQIEARKYADSASKGKIAISESNIHKLQYLKMVLKEVLRLRPPGFLMRQAMSHFKLGNYDVLPKTLILINVWAMGIDPNYWDNPEEFFPERFADSSVDYKGNHFELLPFGSGRRICPGIQMGMVTVELALANLLCCFDWKLPDGIKESDMDMEEKTRLAVFKKSPLQLVPISYPLPLDQDSET